MGSPTVAALTVRCLAEHVRRETLESYAYIGV
jgi:hypothetical protein